MANKIMFVLEGEINCISGQSQDTIVKGRMFFLPKGCRMCVSSVVETKRLVIRLFDIVKTHECFDPKYLSQVQQVQAAESGTEGRILFPLKILPIMEKYLDMLEQRLHNRPYIEGKIRELMLMLRAFYPKKDLYRFFLPYR